MIDDERKEEILDDLFDEVETMAEGCILDWVELAHGLANAVFNAVCKMLEVEQ
jgi:hypothetical protein